MDKFTANATARRPTLKDLVQDEADRQVYLGTRHAYSADIAQRDYQRGFDAGQRGSATLLGAPPDVEDVKGWMLGFIDGLLPEAQRVHQQRLARDGLAAIARRHPRIFHDTALIPPAFTIPLGVGAEQALERLCVRIEAILPPERWFTVDRLGERDGRIVVEYRLAHMVVDDEGPNEPYDALAKLIARFVREAQED